MLKFSAYCRPVVALKASRVEGGVVNKKATAPASRVVGALKCQNAKLLPATPGSNQVPVYRASPLLFLGPAKMLASTFFCSAEMHDPSRAGLALLAAVQVGTSRCRLNAAWQACPSFTWPSVAPSSASQRSTILRPMSWNSAGLTALVRSGWPMASLEATLAYCWAFHSWAVAALGRLKPGLPASTPSYWSA